MLRVIELMQGLFYFLMSKDICVHPRADLFLCHTKLKFPLLLAKYS